VEAVHPITAEILFGTVLAGVETLGVVATAAAIKMLTTGSALELTTIIMVQLM